MYLAIKIIKFRKLQKRNIKIFFNIISRDRVPFYSGPHRHRGQHNIGILVDIQFYNLNVSMQVNILLKM